MIAALVGGQINYATTLIVYVTIKKVAPMLQIN